MNIDWKMILTVALAIVLANLINKFVVEKALEKFEEFNYDDSE